MRRLDPGIVEDAARRLEGISHRTPVLTSQGLNLRCGAEVFLKCENFQRAGAFKFRGAYNALCQLGPAERQAGVITHSSGNHGQAVALAARLLGIAAVIVMPEGTSRVKLEAAQGYGARIVICAPDRRESTTEDLIAREGYTLVHPYDDDRIIAGQGTAARELFLEAGPLDALLVPVGGGGLISGSALAAANHSPSCRIVGVEPTTAADARRSLQDGRIHTLAAVPHTIADGLRTRAIGERNLSVMKRYVSEIVTADEATILPALRFVWERLKIVIEPSSAVALVPLLEQGREVVGSWVPPHSALLAPSVDRNRQRPQEGDVQNGAATHTRHEPSGDDDENASPGRSHVGLVEEKKGAEEAGERALRIGVILSGGNVDLDDLRVALAAQ